MTETMTWQVKITEYHATFRKVRILCIVIETYASQTDVVRPHLQVVVVGDGYISHPHIYRAFIAREPPQLYKTLGPKERAQRDIGSVQAHRFVYLGRPNLFFVSSTTFIQSR
jgi:hypothetical protein